MRVKRKRGCCVSYGFGARMIPCAHQFKDVRSAANCPVGNRMGGKTIFYPFPCEVVRNYPEYIGR